MKTLSEQISVGWFPSRHLFVAELRSRPELQAPGVDSPGEFRRAETDSNAPAGTNSFADVGWWEAFNDPQLTTYLAEALTNSWDIKNCRARVLQAGHLRGLRARNSSRRSTPAATSLPAALRRVGPTRIPSGCGPAAGIWRCVRLDEPRMRLT